MENYSTKKVLYIHSASGSGGVLEALLTLVKELDKSEYPPKILCPGTGISYETFKKNGIDVGIEKGIKNFYHITGSFYTFKNIHKAITAFFNIFYSAIKIYKTVKKEKPAIVHINSITLIGAGIGAKAAKVPVVWHIRENLGDGYFGLRKKIIKSIINKLSDAIIAITETDAEKFSPSAKINVIYDSVNFDKFDRNLDSRAFKKEFNIKENEKTVGMFGGISRIKGTLEFIKAAEIISKSKQNYKFFIFGNSIYSSKNPIKRLTKKFILQVDYQDKVFGLIDKNYGHIKFSGNRCNIPQIMAGLDLIVFPSTVPHSALPVIEAGAMAKPVIASNFGEISEKVIQNETGILVQPNNPLALAKAMSDLLENYDRRSQLGEEANQQAIKQFNIKNNIKKIVKIYDEILEKYKCREK